MIGWLVFLLALLFVAWGVSVAVAANREDTEAAQHDLLLDELWDNGDLADAA